MGYAVELFCDPKSERAVCEIWDGLGAALGKPSLSELGARPHVSLAVYSDDLDASGLSKRLHGFSKQLRDFAGSVAPFEFKLSSVGTFPGSEGVVFLAPVATRQLLAVHARFHEVFSQYDESGAAYYLPGNWVPHCTVAIDLAAPEVMEAIAYCREAFQPVTGKFQEIGLVEFRPVRELNTYKLG